MNVAAANEKFHITQTPT
uniref:Uncharacterized protein n=1 Tax=Arundo donax TaxID=35708 RepID=A0A0A9FYB1_ARUDO